LQRALQIHTYTIVSSLRFGKPSRTVPCSHTVSR
jgi:hypothetical protein